MPEPENVLSPRFFSETASTGSTATPPGAHVHPPTDKPVPAGEHTCAPDRAKDRWPRGSKDAPAGRTETAARVFWRGLVTKRRRRATNTDIGGLQAGCPARGHAPWTTTQRQSAVRVLARGLFFVPLQDRSAFAPRKPGTSIHRAPTGEYPPGAIKQK